ncbi:MAG TPA: RHS repeat-associated core domain-containing protein, partial [Thermoanaerobaculia bacterium]|nr:RHS repeat-associated core domain-containing protein [Thermoanaerobaculia bacterium]
TKLGYDEHGRLLKSVDAANNTTTYGYTRDVLTSITDANDNTTTYHYDPLKRLDKTTFPDGKFETYTYYADGLLKTKTDRMGQTLTYEYDAFKRLKKKIYPNPAQTITYTYEGQKLKQVDDLYASPAETHTFGYDNSYRVQQNVQSTRGTLTYTYTPDDRVDTMTIAGTPNVTTAHTYYADGSLKTIVWSPQAGQFKYDYTPRGQYQTVTFPNGQTRSYSYDDQGRLTSLANALGATNIATYAYGYDVDWASGQNTMLGQRVSMTATVPSQGFNGAQTKYSYDPLYQLKKAEYPAAAPFNSEVHQWTYDAIGNRLTNQVNAAIQTYTYEKIGANPKNAQKLLGDGVNTYAYDFNGSQTSRTGFGFVNDPDNRLASINGGTTAMYTYDYQGRRTSKTVAGVTTKYLYDRLNLLSETTAGATTRYAFGPSIDEPLAMYASGAVSYLNADGLGSVVATNSTAGTVTHGTVFDAWGVTKADTGTRTHSFTYTGREVGEAGLQHYRERWQYPSTGRFTQEDPLGIYDGPSLYLYVRGQPTQLFDPTGLVSEGECLAACYADAFANYGVGFLPYAKAITAAWERSGHSLNFFQDFLGVDKIVSSSPTRVAAAAGGVAKSIAKGTYDNLGGKEALQRAEDIATRKGFSGRSAKEQAKVLERLGKLRAAARQLGRLGTIFNILNAIDLFNDLDNCNTKCEACGWADPISK